MVHGLRLGRRGEISAIVQSFRPSSVASVMHLGRIAGDIDRMTQ
jgi:hypothetical protein